MRFRKKWTKVYRSERERKDTCKTSSNRTITGETSVKAYRKVISPFMNHVRSWSSKTMRSTIFRRNKVIRTYQLDKWIHGWRHTLNQEKLGASKDYFTIENSFFLVDARRHDEYMFSHLKGAINFPSMVPSSEFMNYVHRSTPVVVYCTVGLRSGILTRRLRKLGFHNAMTLSGSMYKWVNEGRPLYRESEIVAGVVPQHWLASLLLLPDYVRHPQVKTARGPRLFGGAKRVFLGTKQALMSTHQYHQHYRKRYKMEKKHKRDQTYRHHFLHYDPKKLTAWSTA